MNPRPLSPGLARCEGSLQGAAVTLHLASWRGAGWESLTVGALADAQGALRTVTACGLPERGRLRPILGIDVVALAGRLSLIALDLSPLDPRFHDEHAAPLLTAIRQAAAGLVPRRMPEFAQHCYSPLALIAGAPSGCEQAAFDAAQSLVRGIAMFPSLDPSHKSASLDDERATQAFARNLACRAAERRNRKEADVLGRIFGAPIAERILNEGLFPSP